MKKNRGRLPESWHAFSVIFALFPCVFFVILCSFFNLFCLFDCLFAYYLFVCLIMFHLFFSFFVFLLSCPLAGGGADVCERRVQRRLQGAEPDAGASDMVHWRPQQRRARLRRRRGLRHALQPHPRSGGNTAHPGVLRPPPPHLFAQRAVKHRKTSLSGFLFICNFLNKNKNKNKQSRLQLKIKKIND